MSTLPRVTAVIATIGRPELLRRAVRSLLAQDYPGEVEVIVSYDHIAIDPLEDVAVPAGRTLRTVANQHRQGLAGGRNTGAQLGTGELIGFCDDDDEWLPGKLDAQVRLWREHPEAAAVSCSVLLRSDGRDHRMLAPARTEFEDLLRDRVAALHSTSTIYRREDLLPGGAIGPFDEELPASYGEDYDFLLRTARTGPILSVTAPLVRVLWDRPSFFARRWENMAAGLTYLLRKFPEFESSPRGLARIAGQVAFCHAAAGHRGRARTWARAALRRDPRQLRAWAALVVAAGVISGETLVRWVEKTGKGL
ncbi:glycosyltransferase family 2 protein [Rothia kristinae]|uniref:Glycosyl transferase family 2 n=2 Tax=Rothia kristinae TaxID=37923 RepID=A0A1S2N335_9MICC|nr:glycosyltransferase family A protein [Rothia kristinae]MDN5640948.1 glycosyltransferase family 2 protein [Actinomycetes bacterium]OIJ36209.1 glycosyl transferase family 2 [Rothia kristinae]QQC59999.1 glycosyltransferase family 2 protein [Rothia kristinae]